MRRPLFLLLCMGRMISHLVPSPHPLVYRTGNTDAAIPAFIHLGWPVEDDDTGFVLKELYDRVSVKAHHFGDFIDGVREFLFQHGIPNLVRRNSTL